MTDSQQKVRVLIVDDEPPARDLIAALLRDEPDVAIAGECANGPDAVEAILTLAPDVVFLDVQMPGLDGFGVLEEVSRASHTSARRTIGKGASPSAPNLEATPAVPKLPLIIFVTAYDRHAVRAFEVHALDYLLKPFEFDRLYEALQRARARLRQPPVSPCEHRLLGLLEELKARENTWDRIAVRDSGRTLFLKPDQIDWLEAEGNYVRLHLGKKSHLLRETMGALEQRLAARKFLRINRSTLVNLEQVAEWQPLFHGDSVLILKDGARLTLSRVYRDRFQQFTTTTDTTGQG